jgi:hypothetical protein
MDCGALFEGQCLTFAPAMPPCYQQLTATIGIFMVARGGRTREGEIPAGAHIDLLRQSLGKPNPARDHRSNGENSCDSDSFKHQRMTTGRAG